MGTGRDQKLMILEKPKRGAKGVIAMQTSERNGGLISAKEVSEMDEVILITNKGMLVRTKVSEISFDRKKYSRS